MPGPERIWRRRPLAVNGWVRCSPNSSIVSASSLALVRTALSTSTTFHRDRSSRAPSDRLRQRIGVGGVDPFGRGQLGGPPSTAPPTGEHVQRHHRDDDHAQPDQQRRRARRLRAAVQAVGRRDRCAAPVAAAQRRLYLVAPQIVDLTGADRLHPVRNPERVGVVDGRHGQHRVEVAEIAGGPRAVRPARRPVVRRSCRRTPPTAGCGGRSTACRWPTELLSGRRRSRRRRCR